MEHYRVLLSIVCRHDYFADGLARPLSLSPTAACARLLRRYGLLFVAAPAGGSVLYRDGALLAGFNEAAPLTFAVASDDSDLLKYTQADVGAIPDNWGGAGLAEMVFYADNIGAAPAAGGEVALAPLFSGAALPLRPTRFHCRFAGPVGGAKLALLDRLRRLSAWEATAPANAGDTLPLDLRGLDPGRYTLQVDGADQQDFYLQPHAGKNGLGIVAVYPGGPAQAPYLDAASCALDADGVAAPDRTPAAAPPVYALLLQARAIRLRYVIHSADPDPRRFQHWAIAAERMPDVADSDQTFAFTPTAPAHAGDPWIYEADKPLPLQQVPSLWNFTLAPDPRQGIGKASGNSVRLPYARGDVTPRAVGKPAQYWSDVYVYV